MGNETCLPIRSTDASLLCSPVSSFVLKNLLHVPNKIKKKEKNTYLCNDKIPVAMILGCIYINILITCFI